LKYLLLEPMSIHREPPHTIEETIQIMEKINQDTPLPFYLCLDLGHGKKSSHNPLNPYQWLEELAPRVRSLHLQQTDGKSSPHWPFTPEYNQKGIISPTRVIEILERGGKGDIYLFLELFHSRTEEGDRKLLADYRESVRLWKKYLPD